MMINKSARGFGSPGKYIQGPGELLRLCEYTNLYGRNVSVIIDSFLYANTSKSVVSIYPEGSTIECISFGGECSENEINKYKANVTKISADVIVGIGGGKTLDTAKAVAAALTIPVIIVPTSASSDAATSASSVIYTDEGIHSNFICHKKHPEIVLVDTEIICKAPVRLLVSGMGDALSTYFEAEANNASDTANYIGEGYRRTKLGLTIARLCYDILLEKGLYAKIAVENECCTEALEDVIEANILLSGLGYENTGCAGAHGIHTGLTELNGTKPYYHGEKVAFATICQLILENKSTPQIEEVINFCLSVDLPVTLEQIGVEDKHKNIEIIAEYSMDSITSEPFYFTKKSLFDAIKTANSLGNMYKDRFIHI